MERPIRVAITQGDFNGVGPEIILKAVADEGFVELYTPVIFADWRIIEQARKQFDLESLRLNRINSAFAAVDGKINVVDLHLEDVEVVPGKPTQSSGVGAVAALELAMKAIQKGEVDLLVTAPISKEAVQSESFTFPGHTEYLNAKAGDEYKAQMVLFDGALRVALVTTHLPLAEISREITKERISQAIQEFSITLRKDFGCERPKIAVLSLNPHIGDGGLLGDEEIKEIIPAIDECYEAGVLAFGPFAADGFFGTAAFNNYDGVLAMYHDQGLAPFKALARQNGTNFTAGLPFVRTSPDHGTAYDIAWRGEADPTSMREAIYNAVDIFRRREQFEEFSANPLKKHAPERQSKNEKTKTADNIEE